MVVAVAAPVTLIRLVVQVAGQAEEMVVLAVVRLPQPLEIHLQHHRHKEVMAVKTLQFLRSLPQVVVVQVLLDKQVLLHIQHPVLAEPVLLHLLVDRL